jgi:MoxR-like ATPase
MKITFLKQDSLNPKDFQPFNWENSDNNVRRLGFEQFTLAATDSCPGNAELLRQTHSDLEGISFCFDQKTYDVYNFIFQYTLAAKKPVLLIGPPGTCKTAVAALLADQVGIPFNKVDCAAMDPMQARKILFGGYALATEAPWKICKNKFIAGTLDQNTVDEIRKIQSGIIQKAINADPNFKNNGTECLLTTDDWKNVALKAGLIEGEAYWQDGILDCATRNGHFVLVDEINRLGAAAADVSNFLSGMSVKVDNHVISMKNAHPNFRFMAAMNAAGPRHSDREPLLVELMNRFIPKTVPDVTTEEMTDYIIHQLTGKQPTITLPNGNSFNASNSCNLFTDNGITGNTHELIVFARKLMEARNIAKEATTKMETNCNANDINRADTYETFAFSRRDVLNIKDRILSIFSQPQSKELAATRMLEAFQTIYTAHFQCYNQEKGHEVAASVIGAANHMELKQAFINLLNTIEINSLSAANNLSCEPAYNEKQPTEAQISKWARRLLPFVDAASDFTYLEKMPQVLWFKLKDSNQLPKCMLINMKTEYHTTIAEIIKEIEQEGIKVDKSKLMATIVSAEQKNDIVVKNPELKDWFDKDGLFPACIRSPKTILDILRSYMQIPAIGLLPEIA